MNMSLRFRLIGLFVALLAALAGLGAWSAWRLWDMGAVASHIVADNYESVQAAQRMKDSVERQDAAVLLATTGARDAATGQPADHRQRFDAALAAAAANITEPGEEAIVADVRSAANSMARPSTACCDPRRPAVPRSSNASRQRSRDPAWRSANRAIDCWP